MDGGRWPLVGRDAEYEAITAALAEDPARSIVLAGPAGAGRTRLAQEALALAERSGRPTRWAAGTGSAALVPLGALAHLFPTVDAASDPLVLLQRATLAIAGDGSGPAPVLGIDDVHLLDQLSITLLHQLAVRNAVTLVLTVRTDNAAPDPAVPLWKDGLATRIELHPLCRADSDGLISEVLGDDVETRTGERLWRLTRGNPMYLREVLEDGQRTGRLQQSGGLWRWEGAMNPSQRLGELVLAQLGDLEADEWRALEVLATTEPVDGHRLLELSSPQAVASLERRGVVVEDVAGRSGQLRAAHPVYTAVVRTRASEAALRPIRRRLVDDQVDPGLPDQLVHRCAALLDSGVPITDAALLTDAARHATAQLDLPLTERLAQAAIDAGGGVEAHLALVEATRWLGQAERSERLAAEAERLATTDDDRARLTAARVLNLLGSLGRTDDAIPLLQKASIDITSETGRAVLTATEAMVAFVEGRTKESVRLATAVLSSAPQGSPARPLAAATAAVGLAVTGQTSQALDTAEKGWAALETESQASEVVLARIALRHAEVMALHLAGRIHELERRTAELHRRNLAAPEWVGDALASLHQGWAALAGGRPRSAIRWLAEALAGLQRQDLAGMRAFCHSLLVMARTLVGDIDGAHALLGEQDPDVRGVETVFEPYASLGRACLLAIEGRARDAEDLVLEAAALAGEQGQSGLQALLLHHAVRYGRAAEVAAPLRDLAEGIDAPLVGDLATHAEAVAAGDARLLDRVSAQFQYCGARLFAADAAAAASAVHERNGARRSAAESATRAVSLAEECGVSATPGLDLLSLPTLTSREEEVARLASLGLSNQAIAQRLVLSVRTVEAHLSHVYTKVGIRSRADLVNTLEAASPARLGRRSARRGTRR